MTSTILLRTKVTAHDIHQLLNEFPQFVFVISDPSEQEKIPSGVLEDAEVMMTESLTEEELLRARRLRWIHVPAPYMDGLCLKAICKQGNLMVTKTLSESADQVGDFVLGAILSFAKKLLSWKKTTEDKSSFTQRRLAEQMWSLRGRTLVQIGLGPAGTEIARRASAFGVKVFGVQDPPSFHADCRKVFSSRELASLLPEADIVSVCPPSRTHLRNWLNKESVQHMQSSAILVVICGAQPLWHQSVEFLAQENQKQFFGVVIDLHNQEEIPSTSALWKIPNLLLTPGVAELPSLHKGGLLRIFRKNLRQFTHGNFAEMFYVEEGIYSPPPITAS